MSNWNFSNTNGNINFYFQQDFRNQQIKMVYKIIKLPKTKENNRFINKLLVQTNKRLFDYYYKLKPSYIGSEVFLKKLGNKGIVETVKQIMFIIKQKEIDDFQNQQRAQQEELMKQREQEEIKKQNIEQIQRPTFSNFLNKDNDDPENVLNKIKEERLKFDQTLPNYGNPKTPEDVGLIPQQTKKNKYRNENQELKQNNNVEAIPKIINNTKPQPINNVGSPNMMQQIPKPQQQNINNVMSKFVDQENQAIPQSLTYNIDEFKPAKTTEKVDFSKPIDKTLLMPNINDINSQDDNPNYSQF